MSLRYRTLLATFGGSNIEIVQSKRFTSNSITGGGSINISFDNTPQAGSKIIMMIGCDQVRTANLVGGTTVFSGIGGSLPGRIWETLDLTNNYEVQNVSGSVGIFRIVMLEIKNYTTPSAIGTGGSFVSSGDDLPTQLGDLNKGEMYLVFFHQQGSNAISTTNSFNSIFDNFACGAFFRLYTTDEINQNTILTRGTTSGIFREYSVKLT